MSILSRISYTGYPPRVDLTCVKYLEIIPAMLGRSQKPGMRIARRVSSANSFAASVRPSSILNKALPALSVLALFKSHKTLSWSSSSKTSEQRMKERTRSGGAPSGTHLASTIC